jgi:hypothetical protein
MFAIPFTPAAQRRRRARRSARIFRERSTGRHPSPPVTAAGALSAVWRSDTEPPVLEIHRCDPTQAFRVHVAGMEADLLIEPVHGNLTVHTGTDGSREVRCPRCDSGDSLVHQEWVYSSRRITAPTLHKVEDPDAGTLWFLGVSGDAEENGVYDLAGALAARFYCMACDRGYTMPANVQFDIDWG